MRPRHALSYLTSRAAARGQVVRLLPGVYCPAGSEASLATKAAAVMAADPNAILTGCAAAALTWWPQCPVKDVQAYRRRPVPVQGFAWLSYRPPEELVSRKPGINIACPALAVLDMIPLLGGRAIDEALRLRVVTLDDLRKALALTRDRPGNALRRWLVEDSRDEPWSELERTVHRRLRTANLGVIYRTNYRICLDDCTYFADVAIPELGLDFELEGYAYHSSREAFERDRIRAAHLVANGWVVIGITWAMVEHQPELVDRLMRAAIKTRRVQLGIEEPATKRRRSSRRSG